MVTAISPQPSRPQPSRPQGSRPRLGLGAGLVAAARGLAFFGLMLAGLGLMLVLLMTLGLTALGAGILIVGNGGPHDQRVLLSLLLLAAGLGIGRFLWPAALLGLRRLADLTRRLAGQWCGVPIDGSYQPAPAAAIGGSASSSASDGCSPTSRPGGTCSG